MDLNSAQVSDEDKLGLCKRYFFLGFAFLQDPARGVDLHAGARTRYLLTELSEAGVIAQRACRAAAFVPRFQLRPAGPGI